VQRLLRLKLGEEVAEYLVDGGLDELLDVVAVVEGLAWIGHQLTLAQLVERARRDERGGFLAGRVMYGHHPEFDGGPDA
jgi:predicted house-cleaning noncanonical NTP pyrophosphatase (MazG superfamily)